MRMKDRIEAMLESCEREMADIDARIGGSRQDIARLLERRAQLEEEVVEARTAYAIIRDAGLKVERNADGVIVASVNPDDAVTCSTP